MSKAIMISIKPEWVAKILNGEKTIEVRKKFPKDYVGWVYIYCTKGKDMVCFRPNFDGYTCVPNLYGNEHFNGKVVARFWCDNVEDFGRKYTYAIKDQHFYEILKGACLTIRDLTEYSPFTHEQLIKGKTNLYAILITKLEIFDIPKELSEFSHKDCKTCIANSGCNKVEKIRNNCLGIPLTKAPQSWCYVED